MYEQNIQSILIEGGAKLLQSFIDEKIWDEARTIKNGELRIKDGLKAPVLSQSLLLKKEPLFSDTISYYKNDSIRTLDFYLTKST